MQLAKQKPKERKKKLFLQALYITAQGFFKCVYVLFNLASSLSKVDEMKQWIVLHETSLSLISKKLTAPVNVGERLEEYSGARLYCKNFLAKVGVCVVIRANFGATSSD